MLDLTWWKCCFSYDPTQITSLLAATIIHDFASLVAVKTKRESLDTMIE